MDPVQEKFFGLQSYDGSGDSGHSGDVLRRPDWSQSYYGGWSPSYQDWSGNSDWGFGSSEAGEGDDNTIGTIFLLVDIINGVFIGTCIVLPLVIYGIARACRSDRHHQESFQMIRNQLTYHPDKKIPGKRFQL